jgi:hypothetical protein
VPVFFASSTPRGRDVREAWPYGGACLNDVVIQSQVDFEPVPGMSAILEPHCSYTIEGYLAYTCPDAADMKVRIDAPPLVLGRWTVIAPPFNATTTTAALTTGFVAWAQEDLDPPIRSVGGVGAPVGGRLLGHIDVAGYGGAIQLGIGQLFSTASPTTVHAGSWLLVTKILER